jgi:pimeloyl-ACP methyl ester carboxylesterase
MPISNVSNHGVKISCRSTAPVESGRAALFIHGLNTNLAFWHPLVVRQLAANRFVLCYDQRGHGGSDMPETGYTIDDLVGDALAVLDAHVVGAADVIAHSFGAGIALQLARKHPDRVRTITLLDGRLRSIQGVVRLGDWEHYPRWSQQLAEAGMTVDPTWEIDCRLPVRLEAVDFSRVSGVLEADGFFVPRLTNKRAGQKYRRLIAETTAFDDYDRCVGLTREVLSDIHQPTLLVYGTHSPFVPSCEILADEMPNAHVELIEGAGHNFPLSLPEATLRALAGWPPLGVAMPQISELTSRGG